MIIALNSFIALLAHQSGWRGMSWRTPIFMAISAVIVGQFAGKKSASVNPALLRKSFAILLFAIAGFHDL
jgi:uncharacterized membrane protein YfcA